MLHGMCAGVGVQVIVLPIDMVTTRFQTTRDIKAGRGLAGTLKSIVKREGLGGLWSGIGPGLLLTLNPGITQLLMSWLVPSRRAASAARAFWSAAVSKAVASTITYPYTRAKVQLQIQGMVSLSAKPAGTLQVLARISAESGVLAVFDGLLPQLTNAVLKEALLNMARLKIASTVSRLFRLMRGVHLGQSV